MSKLAHSDDATMEVIDARKYAREFPTALTVIKAIAASDKLPGHPDYLTPTQIKTLCKAWLANRNL